MTSRRSSKTKGASDKLLDMVNEQRARCNLTSLDVVINHSGYTLIESMLDSARKLRYDHSTGTMSEADMIVEILRSPKKQKHKQKSPKKVTSSKNPSPYKIQKKARIPKESTPPRKSPKKLSAASSRNISPSSSASTKVAALRDSISSRGTLVDRPLQPKTLNTPIEDRSSQKLTVDVVPVAAPERNEAAVMSPIIEVASCKQEKAVVVAEESQTQSSSRKRKSEGEVEQVARKRYSPEVVESAIEIKAVEPVKSDNYIIINDDTIEEEEIIATEEKEEEEVPIKEAIIQGEEGEDSLSVVEDGDDEGEDSIEVSRVVTQRIEIDSKMEEKQEEEAAAAAEKEEILSVDSDLRVEQSEPKKGGKDLKAVITQLRNSLDDTMSSNDTKSARSDDVFSEGEAEPVPSSSSVGTASKPSLRERIDRFRAIFSPASRPASSIPRLSPPKYSQSPPRPQLSSIVKPIVKSVATKPIEAKSTFKPVVAKTVEKFEPKTTAKTFEKAVDKPTEKPVSKPVENVVEKQVEKSVEKRAEKVVEKSVEKPKEKAIEKPQVKVLAKAAPPVALASPPKSPPKKAFEGGTLVAPAIKSTRPASSAHQLNGIPAITSQNVKTASTSSTHTLPAKVVAPIRGSSIQVAVPMPIRAPSQIKPAAAPIKSVPAQAAPAISLANPFQKAQQQQQQQVLAATSSIRAAKQAAAPAPIASTAHIELEEPDSAYSDSEDEETVRRRQQHKPWETKEGLAKALEEQASIDADMIFGIPRGAVPIDEILPPETEHARAKRARPRSSSATWSRDGLKQIEIDRYNERMGIQGPGVLLPITVQDDGSGTPSRSHRLSAIAQSAVSQGQISRKPSISAHRGSMSPVRPGSVLSSYASNNLAPSTIKYPQLTPNRAKPSTIGNASAQKAKASKSATIVNVSSSSKQSKPPMTKNPFQNGNTSTLQTTSRLAATGTSKTTAVKK